MKNSKNSYITASFCYIFGNGVGQGLMLLSTIIFTRIMSKYDFGMYSTYYSVVSILNTLVGANLFYGLNNAYIDFKKDIHNYRASNLVLSSIVFLIVSVIGILINILFIRKLSIFLLFMALVHSYGFFVVNYYNNSANMENRYIPKTILLMLPNILQIGLSVLFIKILPTDGLNARVIGSTLGVSGCAMFTYICMIKGQSGFVNKKYWKYGLTISLPSVLSSISYMLMSQCDHIMVTAFHGADETAVYALVYNIGYILVAVMQATNGVLTAWLFNSLNEGKTENAKTFQKWYLLLFAQFAIGILMISPEIIKILSPPSYWDFKYIGPFVIGSYLMVMYSFYTTEALFYKKTVRVSTYVCVAALVNVVLNYILIPKFGGIGAACTSAFAYLVLFIMLYIYGNKLNKNLFCLSRFVVMFLSVSISSVIFLYIADFLVLRLIIFGTMLILSLIYMYIKKDEIKSLERV